MKLEIDDNMNGRQILYIAAICCFGLFFSSCTKEDNTTVNTGGTDNAPATPNQQLLLDMVNDARTSGHQCGNTYYPPVGEVTWNVLLEDAAKQHSEYMNGTSTLSHTGRNGSDAGERITAAGYQWQAYGENIAEGYSTEEEVIHAWLGSQGHCANIMNGDFKEMGVGTSGRFWTQVFAAHQ